MAGLAGTGREIADLIARAIENRGMDASDKQSLGDFLEPMPVLTSWIKGGGSNPRFQHLEFGTGRGDILPHEMGWLGSSSTPAQTIGNNSFTSVTSMDDFSTFGVQQGLRLDTAGEYIEIGPGMPGDSVFLIYAYAQFASNSTGWRAIDMQFYDPVAASWGNTFEPTFVPANPDAVTNLSGVLVYSTNANPQLNRIRFRVKQNSGGDLAINIPQLLVTRLR